MVEPPLRAVLTISEHEPTRLALIEALREARFRVVEAANRLEALRLVSTRPDLLIMETLPDRDDSVRQVSEGDEVDSPAVVFLPLDDSLTNDSPSPKALSAMAGALADVLRKRKLVADRLAEERIAHLERDVRAHDALKPQAPQNGSVRKSRPDEFCELVVEYELLLDDGIDQRAYRVDHGTSSRLQSLAERLARIGAGPRDVIEVHSTSLRRKTQGAVPEKSKAYTEEGRLMLLELMGHLVSRYRQGNRPSDSA